MVSFLPTVLNGCVLLDTILFPSAPPFGREYSYYLSTPEYGTASPCRVRGMSMEQQYNTLMWAFIHHLFYIPLLYTLLFLNGRKKFENLLKQQYNGQQFSKTYCTWENNFWDHGEWRMNHKYEEQNTSSWTIDAITL